MNGLSCESVCYRGVLHDVSLRVRPGRICALLGPSGVGKSTLLWILAGLWEPDSGQVTRGPGAPGMVFQQPGLWDHLTVQQHLKLIDAKPDTAERVIKQMRLESLRDRKPGRMSGGERQRLSIARALAIEPAWLLLDEPMAHLDGPMRAELFGLLRDALRDTRAGVLIATHHAQETLRLADDVAVMIDGKIEQLGEATEVYQQPANLEVARMTGIASVFNNRVVRPEQLSFKPDPVAESTVNACEFHGAGYLLIVDDSDNRVMVWHDEPLPVGTRGAITTR